MTEKVQIAMKAALIEVSRAPLPVTADTSAAIVGFYLHFNKLAKASRIALFKR